MALTCELTLEEYGGVDRILLFQIAHRASRVNTRNNLRVFSLGAENHGAPTRRALLALPEPLRRGDSS
jgi:hypothetical protein